MTISAIILAKNASVSLERCINSLLWCNEIIVIDDESIDKTATIAKKLGAKVISHPLEKDFSKQRNFALQQARFEWVFFVDADEVVSDHLKKEVQVGIKGKSHVKGFAICRQDSLWGKKLAYGEWGKQWLVRLGRKDAGNWQGKVHETWHIHGKIEKLQAVLEHYPHQTISDFLREINFYTTLRAQELYDQHVSVTWVDIILYPKAKFILNYILRAGFLDGIRGLIIALLMSFHSFLVRGKLWQLHQKKS